LAVRAFPAQTLARDAGGRRAVRADGSVFAWGSAANVPTAAMADVVSVAMTRHRAIALKADGTIIEWGAPSNPVGGTWISFPANLKATAITAGEDFAAAILSDGKPYVWGELSAIGHIQWRTDARDLIALEASRSHLLALRRDGRAIAWGDRTPRNEESNLAVPLEARSGVVAIAASYGINLALRGDGRLITWGALVDAAPPYTLRPPPLVQDDVVAIAANPSVPRFVVLKS